MARIELKDISKAYNNGYKALENLNLVVEEGNFTALLGASGCGKSTTLRIIAGLEQPTGGRLLFNEREMNSVPPKERDIGMVFQNYALYPHLSVSENIAFPLRLRKMEKSTITTAVREAAAMTGLSSLLDRKPKELSGGQRQRVALARALVRKPAVFLFDEPLSNLDARLRTEMRTEIALLQKKMGVTSVYVTHDQVEAMTMAHAIAIMNNGAIEQYASPASMYAAPATTFVAAFLGTPPMNLLEGSVIDHEGQPAFAMMLPDDKKLLFPLERRFGAVPPMPRATFGFRPEVLLFAQSAGSLTLPCVVEVSEFLGYESILYCKAAGSVAFRVRCEGSTPFPLGERTFFLPLEHTHLFDDQGKRIEPIG